MPDEEEKKLLTKEQAYELLPQIHTFLNPAGMLLGADWSIKQIVDLIERATTIEVGGDGCRGTGHGLVVNDGNYTFIQCDDAALAALAGETPQADADE